jgi:hypothetical protein
MSIGPKIKANGRICIQNCALHLNAVFRPMKTRCEENPIKHPARNKGVTVLETSFEYLVFWYICMRMPIRSVAELPSTDRSNNDFPPCEDIEFSDSKMKTRPSGGGL